MESPPACPRAPGPLAWGVLLLWVALVETWFRGPLGHHLPLAAAGLPAVLLLALGLKAARLRLQSADPGRRRQVLLAAALVAGVSTLVRLPALLAPHALISSDSAVAGIIAQELRAGQLPAPIYAPGFPYEGTVKPHLTALLGLVFPAAGTPFLYALVSHLFHLLWTFAVMDLARRAGGLRAAVAAGLLMAVSPRFLVAFSLNNVGQYPEVNALGALALAVLASGADLLAVGFVLGIAIWQQLLGIYFVLAVAAAVLITPALRRPAALLRGLAGFVAAAWPVLVWNAANEWTTFDLFRRGGKRPAERLASIPDQVATTFTVSFPRLFGWVEAGVPPAPATFGAVLVAVMIVGLAWRRRAEVARARGRSPLALSALLFCVVVSVFVVSKFSNRGARRPRYLIPTYTSFAVSGGVALAALALRSRAAGLLAGAGVLAVNSIGLVPWLRGRADADARDLAVVRTLRELGVHTGYAGFWVGPKFTFLGDGSYVLASQLEPEVSWVNAGHAARVRETGPEALVVHESLAPALAARLEKLGIRHQRREVSGLVVLHSFSRRPALDELSGYADTAAPPPGDEDEGDPPSP